MRALPHGITLVVLGAGCAAGCGIIAGVDGNYFEARDAGASGDTGGGSRDAPAGGDGNVIIGPRDGGSVDACPNGSSCMTVPQGWTVVAYDNSRPGCPSTFPAGQDVVVSPKDPCKCSCTTTSPGSCGQATLSVFAAASCAGDAGANFNPQMSNGGCSQTTLQVATGGSARMPALTPTTAVCSGSGTSSKGNIENGRVCSPAEALSCPGGGVCAGFVNDPYKRCLAQAGDQTCPRGFEDKRVVGTAVANDDRVCGACACSAVAPSCSSADLRLYSDSSCNSGSSTFRPTGSCSGINSGTTFRSYKWDGLDLGGCQSPPPSVTGAVTVNGTTTVCCEPD
jgi:hypothetical protein